MSFVEKTVRINELDYAYKLWGWNANKPVMALHGWLDNAASFDVLAPQLKHCQIAALDMAGHGLSDFRHPQGSYNIWDDLADILAVADHLGWEKFSLIGHSRGAIIALMLASTMTDRIDKLIMLDGVSPLANLPEEAPKQLADYIKDQQRAHKRTMPIYKNREDALEARCRPSMTSVGMPREAAQIIVERGLKEVPGGYQWRADPRLVLASAFRMTEAHNKAFLSALKAPALVCLATQGYAANSAFIEELEAMPQFDVRIFEGSHHFHMESQHAAALTESLAQFMGDSD